MKRFAIFAHYDKDNLIDDYVIIYLENLRKSVEKIIFVSDCFVSEAELKKIDHLIFDSICKRHGEYDFGSYKRGFFLLKEKHKDDFLTTDELVFANDSCYCLKDFKTIFEDMKNNDCDAWSLGDDYENVLTNRFYITKNYYLQSYFLVFRKTVFLENFFQNFISNIKKLSAKHLIIHQYEEGMSRLLLKNNKKIFAYFSSKKVSQFILDNYLQLTEKLVSFIKTNSDYNDDEALLLIGSSFDISKMNYVHSNKFYFLLNLGFPLLKRATIVREISTFDDEKLTFFWKEIVEKFTSFKTNIILQNLERISCQAKKQFHTKLTYKAQQPQNSNLYLSWSFNRFLSVETLLKIKKTKNKRLLIKVLKIPVFHKTLVQKNQKPENALNQNHKNKKLESTNFIQEKSRLVIFAHYDKEERIEDYVVDYLKGLKEVARDIIFVSDCNIGEHELSKIKDLTVDQVCKKHGEYDFGSYKRGLEFSKKNLPNYDQLILVNDSCYLTSSLIPIFKEMEQRNSADFWGITQNTEQFSPHIQSYFVVFNKNVFTEQRFFDFFSKVKKEETKTEIVHNYEVGLTLAMLDCGFTKDSFVSKIFDKNPTISKKLITELLPSNLPLIKVAVLNRFLWEEAWKSSKKLGQSITKIFFNE